MHGHSFVIPVPPHFRLKPTVWVLRRRPRNLIDQWDGRFYSRILVRGYRAVRVTAYLDKSQSTPRLVVRLRSDTSLTASDQATAEALLQKVLGLTVNVEPFYAMAKQIPELDQLARQYIGVRPTRFPSLFESLANAIACQQVSLDSGLALLNRFSTTFGLSVANGTKTVTHAFPSPENVLDVPEEELRQLGFSHQKAQAIKEVAYRIVSNDVDADKLEMATNEEALATLESIRGIGRWSAEYVLLRGLGRLNVFPGDDVGAQNNVQALLGLTDRPDYARIKDLTALWRPYAGFVYFHLLLSKLHEKELV